MIAGFHNSSLYEALRVSIGPLVALLRDEEDKTRANAAGALGNLVRNSGLLCQPLIEAHALQVFSFNAPIDSFPQLTYSSPKEAALAVANAAASAASDRCL